MGALRLEGNEIKSKSDESKGKEVEGKKVKVKDVKKQIKAIGREGIQDDEDEEDEEEEGGSEEAKITELGDDFVERKSSSNPSNLITLSNLSSNQSSSNVEIFKPYVIYLDRSVPKSILEFIVRSFGVLPNNLGWDSISGSGSSFNSKDPRITHVVIDRPEIPKDVQQPTQTKDGVKAEKRAFIQPQWIADCVNQGKILPTEKYAPGVESLPSHLSPFVDEKEVDARGGYVPMEARAKLAEELGLTNENEEEVQEDEDDDDEEEDEEEDEEMEEDSNEIKRPALNALLKNPKDENGELLSAAELEAESLGGEKLLSELESLHQEALKKVNKPKNKVTSTKNKTEEEEAKEMATSLMSNKERKLHKKLAYSKKEREAEKLKLEERRKENEKEMKRKASGKTASKKVGSKKA